MPDRSSARSRRRLRAYRKLVLKLQGEMSRETDFKHALCADINGLCLHAEVRCKAKDRQALVPRPRLHMIRFNLKFRASGETRNFSRSSLPLARVDRRSGLAVPRRSQTHQRQTGQRKRAGFGDAAA